MINKPEGISLAHSCLFSSSHGQAPRKPNSLEALQGRHRWGFGCEVIVYPSVAAQRPLRTVLADTQYPSLREALVLRQGLFVSLRRC